MTRHQLIFMTPDQGDNEADWTEMEPEWHLAVPAGDPDGLVWLTACGEIIDEIHGAFEPGTLAMVTCAACLTAYRAEHPEGRQMSLLTEPRP